MSWPDAPAMEILSGEPALTVIPNLLVAGVLAVAVGLTVAAWSVWCAARPFGGWVLIGLSLLLLVVGGGLAPPVMGVLVGAVATRIGVTTRHPPRRLGRTVGPLWPWFLAALKDATRFCKRHRAVLADRPVWSFSSGPLGTELVDEEGRDVLEAARPKEFDELEALLRPRGVGVFFGAWEPEAPLVGLGERLVRRMPAAPATPAGDFRDWPAIDAWAADIARDQRATQTAATEGG